MNSRRKYMELAVLMLSMLTLGTMILFMFIRQIGENVYFPSDILPDVTLNASRQASHIKLTRRLSNTVYKKYEDLMTGLVQKFMQYNIWYIVPKLY